MSKHRDELPRDEALSALYRQAAAVEPPAALDRLILDAARREAAPRAVPLRPWWRRWAAPVGVFATLVITVSLTLLVEREQRDLLPASAPAPTPAAEPLAAPEAAQAPSAQPATSVAKKAPAPRAAAVLPGPAKAVPPPPPQVFPAEPAPARVEAEMRFRRDEAPAPAAAPPVLYKAAPAEQMTAEGAATAPGLGAGRLEERAPLARPAAAPAADLVIRPPEPWLEEIRRLRREGRQAEADEQLAAFRRRYPAYRLPEDLR